MQRQISIVGILAIVLWTVTVSICRLPAQETKDDHRPAVQASLTDTSLLQLLTDMGFEPKKLKQGYVVAIKQGEWTYNVQFVISANKEKLGLNANMGSVEDASAVTAAQWMGLLAANTDIAPSFFYYNKMNHILYMHRVLDNRYLTAAILRQQIDAFTGNIKETADLWKFTK